MGTGLCVAGGDPALPGVMTPATGLAAYGDWAYGESGCEGGPSVRTLFVGGGAKPVCDAAGEGLCWGGEKAWCAAWGGTWGGI